MAPSGDGAAVLVTLEDGQIYRIEILRRPLPRRGGSAIFYRCPWCGQPRRHLYRLTLAGNKLTKRYGLRCQGCAGLRYASQGSYLGAGGAILFGGKRAPLPRNPWDPRAVSDPRMVVRELPGLLKDDS